MSSAWPWLMVAALIALPVALAFVGDEPDNTVTHEDGGDQDDDGEDGPGLLAAA